MSDKGIFKAMSLIMKEVGAIGKDKKADPRMGGYAYRGIESVYNGLQTVMAKHEVFSVPKVLTRTDTERKTANGGILYHVSAVIQYTFYHSDGSSVIAEVYGEGMDTGDKASNKAMSIAHKYALTQAFCLMTEDVIDPDDERPEVPKKPESSPNPPTNGKSDFPNLEKEITKDDEFNSRYINNAANQLASAPPKSDGGPSVKQLNRLWAIANKNQWSTEAVHLYIKQRYKIASVKELTIPNYNLLCTIIEQSPGGVPK
jgi:hypothetical protein